jgi:hypothetical protein
VPDFDFTQLNALAADLGEVPRKMIPLVRQAVEVTARNIKDSWKPDAKVAGSAKRYPSSIDYTMKLDADSSIGADIGPNLDRTGGGWGFLEDAPGGVLSAPQHAGRKAAKKNEADFVKGLLQAGEDALK